MTTDSMQRPATSILHGLALVLLLSTGGIGDSPRGRHYGAPEIDPSLWSAGAIVLVGGALWLTSGRRKPSP